ncbi:S-adenosylhomocysteine hydrolase [Caballeronia megalochromosomata]|nr:S-adenosylhomocysteine hydrolase [Caballeronia megalochromosomata]
MVRAGSSTRIRESTVEQRVLRSIRRRPGAVVLRSDLRRLGGKSQLTRVLAKLVTSRKLIRVGHGIYCKTRKNRFTGRLAPAATFEAIVSEVFERLEIDIGPGKLFREYNAGKSTQIPMQTTITTGARRIRRRLQIGTRTVAYEGVSGRARK